MVSQHPTHIMSRWIPERASDVPFTHLEFFRVKALLANTSQAAGDKVDQSRTKDSCVCLCLSAALPWEREPSTGAPVCPRFSSSSLIILQVEGIVAHTFFLIQPCP